MLLGWPSGGDFHIDPKVFTRSAYWGFYVHDDWRIVPKLTLNLGLRYDFDVPRWETQDRQSYWDLEAQSPIQVPGYDTRGVIRFVDADNRSPFEGDMNNVQPRLGFAYALNPKTSIRGGYGLFFTLSRATVFGHTGGGFNVNSTPTFTLDSNATRYATLADPYPNGMLLPPGREQGDAPSSAWAPAPSCPATTATPSTTPGTCPSSARSAGARCSRPTTPAAAARTCSSRSPPSLRCLRSIGRWGARH